MASKAPKVLIVDEDTRFMRYYVRELRDAGFEVVLASTAKEGYDLATSQHFDVVVLDVMMDPGELFDVVETAGGLETGLSLAGRILKDASGGKIVFLTNSPSSAVKHWASKTGVTYLCKADAPPDKLPQLLRELLTHWDIKSKGRKRSARSIVNRHCDIAILTALSKELEAVLKQQAGWEALETIGSVRRYHRITTSSGLEVVASNALGMGQLNAAMLTRDVLAEWNPSKIILVGIAAGLGSDVALGDVVASDQIVDYELGKVMPEGMTPRWSVYRSDPSLVGSLQTFTDRTWVNRISTRRPDGRSAADSRAHIGVVLSGNKVIADEATAGALTSVWIRAAALEMEAAGVASALYQYQDKVGFVMIKGICDNADSQKTDEWQSYAAEAAAAYAWQFIESLTRPLL